MSKLNVANIHKLRGVIVAIDCDVCDGECRVWRNPGDRFAVTCPACDGDGWVNARVSVEEFTRLMKQAKP